MGGTAADARANLRAAPVHVDAMYSGPRCILRPLHDQLEDLVLTLGPDIRLCPGQTIVPVYRNHVIAQIKPATRTRIDFGLALGDRRGQGRLLETGGYTKRDRITHRVAISAPEDIDVQLRAWLREAYERDG
jgi:Domain of unknown function (DUF5655)